MHKKKIILADYDEMYLSNLSNYFMEKNAQLEISAFTKKDKLYQYLSENGQADILAVDEMLAKPELTEITPNSTHVALSTSMNPIPGYVLVKKYQKTETLLSEILLRHAECTGSIETIKGSSHTKVIAFYSPAGGTGKTSLALALSAACIKDGMSVFYLNLEEIDSIKDLFAPSPGSLSELFLSLKTKGANVGVKLASCAGTEPNAGFCYLSGVDSISEYGEITGAELRQLFRVFRTLAEYDCVIVDLSSGFSEKSRAVMEEADMIFVPILSAEPAIVKMLRFMEEAGIHEEYQAMFQKMRLIVNQSPVSGIGKEIRESGLLNRLPCCAALGASPLFIRRMDVLRSGDVLRQMLEPLLQEIRLLRAAEE